MSRSNSRSSFNERPSLAGSETPIKDDDHVSRRPSNVAEMAKTALGEGFNVCGCWVSGNAISLLTAAVLFAIITGVQYIYALKANSVALQADCVSMGVDVLAFLGNLFAECNPFPNSKRKLELTMSGISHVLLLAFTINFIIEGLEDAGITDSGDGDDGDDDGDVNGWIVLGFAIGGLVFDLISLLVYKVYGYTEKADEALLEGEGAEDALTCGINTNMCAALLHVISDLARSTTTLIESLVILNLKDVDSTKADGVSTLIVCSIIVVGAQGALLTWMREVYLFMVSDKPTEVDANSSGTYDYRQVERAVSADRARDKADV